MPFVDIEKRRQYMRDYKKKFRDSLLARRRELYAIAHPSSFLTATESDLRAEAARVAKAACDRRYRVKHKTKVMMRKRVYHLKHTHHLTESEFAALWESHHGRCPVCEVEFDKEWPSRKQNAACVDHNHETGIVRGLLCRRCNAGIGLLNDDSETLLAASAYVACADIAVN